MRLSALFTTLAALAPTILALPTDPIEPANASETTAKHASPDVIIRNHCPFPVFVTSVGKNVGPTREIIAGGVWTEPEYWSGIGTAIEFTRTFDGLYTDAPVLVLGYSYTAGVSIYYDLGLHAGNPFEGYNVRLSGKGGDNIWDPKPKPPSTKAWFGETDLLLDLCL
ncbi:hypothetical protein K458DRAFT_423190 [Lentithecium fluviatile CBS 122367]|uniref:Uncharacterized protein n=1 Tax=Lentithecium fluviatile CBS 122367 TaxID=1168545 RepID=A0A6G1IJ24_9PLEO|nr:hypothetical protein K458DRAFT_423190 [Lentithecium fluviatile CBS 122367]